MSIQRDERPLNENLMQLKQLPFSEEAEEAVIGALLIDDVYDEVQELISIDDFYYIANQKIYSVIHSLAIQHRPYDYVTVTDEIKKKDYHEIDARLIADIAERTLSSANVKIYAKLIRDNSTLRKVIKAGREISELGYGKEKEASDILDAAEKTIFSIAENYHQNRVDDFVDARTACQDTYQLLQKLSKSSSSIVGLSTGWDDYDKLTSGLQNGDLIIVAARPSMGKTAFAVNIATHVAVSEKKNVAFFSLEMPREHLLMRMMSSIGNIPLEFIRTGQLDKLKGDSFKMANDSIHQSKLFIDDSTLLNSTNIRTKCRRLVKKQGPLGLVVIDYLQLMEAHNKNDNKTHAIADITRALKLLAKELNCPVIVLSQLNRAVEQRSSKRPINADLRDSGAIEQDADMITFLHRPAVYADDADGKADRTTEVIIAKQRMGPIGTIKLTFMGEYTKFVNYIAESHF